MATTRAVVKKGVVLPPVRVATVDQTAYRAAKLQWGAARYQANVELLRSLLSNPAIEILGGLVAVQAAYDNKLLNNVSAGIAETAILGAVTVQQLAPTLPYLSQAAGDLLKLLGPALGALSLAAVPK